MSETLGHPLAFSADPDADDNLVSPVGSAAAKDLDMIGDAQPPAKAHPPLMWVFVPEGGSAAPFRLTSSAAVLPAGEVRVVNSW